MASADPTHETWPNSVPRASIPPHELVLESTASGYVIAERLASGGMGSVHLGVRYAPLRFRRLVAVKRLHPHLSRDPEFVARFQDEIGIVSRLSHPNVVQALDVLDVEGDVALVMEFVDGLTLTELQKDAAAQGAALPFEVVVGIVSQALHGIHAAHELTDDDGNLLHVVHRDISPQNIMIGRDGLVKVLDFGVAKAASETHVTRTGQLSGKAAYMSPEQVTGRTIDRRADVFAAGVVLWEALTGQRLFRAQGMPETAALHNIMQMAIQAPSSVCPGIPPELDEIVLRSLDRDVTRRFGSARDFALALEAAVSNSSTSVVATGLSRFSSKRLAQRAQMISRLRARIENEGSSPTQISGIAPRTNAFLLQQSLSDAQSEETTALAAAGQESNSEKSGFKQSVVREPKRHLAHGQRWLLAAALVLCGGAVALAAMQLGGRRAVATTTLQSSAHTSVAEHGSALAPKALAPKAALPPEEVVAAAVPRDVAPSPPADLAAPGALKPEPQKLAPRAPDSAGASSGVATKNGTSGARDATPKRTRTQRANASNKPASCSPPTYMDADGIRHFKLECL